MNRVPSTAVAVFRVWAFDATTGAAKTTLTFETAGLVITVNSTGGVSTAKTTTNLEAANATNPANPTAGKYGFIPVGAGEYLVTANYADAGTNVAGQATCIVTDTAGDYFTTGTIETQNVPVDTAAIQAGLATSAGQTDLVSRLSAMGDALGAVAAAKVSLEVVGWFTSSSAAVHRLSLGATSVTWSRLTETCVDLRAYQNGREIPIWVQPGATKAGTAATVFVRTIAAGVVYLHAGGDGAWQATTRQPQFAAGYNETAFSFNHSLAGANNPVVSMQHPSAVYIAAGVGGHCYWALAAAFSPVGAPTSNAWEDPSVFHSDNGTTWTAQDVNASGYSNITYSAHVPNTFESDPCLVWDAANSVLYAYWGVTVTTPVSYVHHRMQSTNGAAWTDDTVCTGLVKDGDSTAAQDFSPAILKIGTAWHMWTVAKNGASQPTWLKHYTSTDGLAWTFERRITNFWPSAFWGPWHIHVAWDATRKMFIMLASMSYAGASGSDKGAMQCFAFSTDGVNWELDERPAFGSGYEPTAWGAGLMCKGCIYSKSGDDWGLAYSATKTSGYAYSIASTTFSTDWSERPFDGLSAVFLAGSDFLNLADPAWKVGTGTVEYTANSSITVKRTAGAAGSLGIGTLLGNSWTVEFRAKLVNTNSKFAIGVGVYGDSALAWNVTAGKVGLASGADQATLAADTSWHVFKLTRNGNTYTAYVDAVQVASETYSGVAQDAVGFDIWASGASAGDGIEIDYVIVYPYAASTATVTAVDVAGNSAAAAADAAAANGKLPSDTTTKLGRLDVAVSTRATVGGTAKNLTVNVTEVRTTT